MALVDNYDKVNFYSGFRYQNIATEGSADVSVSSSGTTYTVNHNLGYVPSARVWFEPEYQNGGSYTASGQVWCATNSQYADSYIGGNITAQSIDCYLTTTQLKIVITSVRNTTIPIYWRIYYDG